jgi:hypothetical protein
MFDRHLRIGGTPRAHATDARVPTGVPHATSGFQDPSEHIPKPRKAPHDHE